MLGDLRRRLSLALAALVLLVAAVARAEAAGGGTPSTPLAGLSVQHDDGADDCDDAAAIAQAVQRIMGEATLTTTAHPRLSFEVRMSSSPAGYAATLTARGARRGERRISDIGSDCRGLSDAVAVTLAIILDDERAERAERAAPSETPSPVLPPRSALPPSVPAEVAPPSALPRSEPTASGEGAFAVRLVATGGLSLGVLERVTPTLSAGVDLHFGRVLVGADALWLPQQDFELERGEVRVGLIAARLRGCVMPFGRVDATNAAACAVVAGGSLSGQARGFDRNQSERRPWWALGAGAAVFGPMGGPVWWQAHGDLLAPVHHERFVIDGAGVAHETPPLGLALGAGLLITIW